MSTLRSPISHSETQQQHQKIIRMGHHCHPHSCLPIIFNHTPNRKCQRSRRRTSRIRDSTSLYSNNNNNNNINNNNTENRIIFRTLNIVIIIMSSSYCQLLLYYQQHYTTMRKSTISTTFFVESFALPSSSQSATTTINTRTIIPLQQQLLRRCTSSSIRRQQLMDYHDRYYQRRQHKTQQLHYHTQPNRYEQLFCNDYQQKRWRSSSTSFIAATFLPTKSYISSSKRPLSSSLRKVSQVSDASELGEEQQQQQQQQAILNDYDSSLIPTDHNSTSNNKSKSTKEAKRTTAAVTTTKPRPSSSSSSSSTTTKRSSSSYSASVSSSSIQYSTNNDVYDGDSQEMIYKTMSYAKFTTDVVFPTVNLPNNVTTTTTTTTEVVQHDHPYHPYNHVNRPTNDPITKAPHLAEDLEQQRKQKVHPEYIVLSRTPIPISAKATTTTTTTVATDDAADRSSSITQLKADTNYNSDTCTSNEDLLDPYDLLIKSSSSSDGNTTATSKKVRIPYMKALSPSSIKEFQACPQSFLFQYILGLRQPTTTILAKGTVCHAALERIFDIEPQDRSLHVLQNLFRTVWSEERNTDKYRFLFEEDIVVDELVSETSSSDGTESDAKSPKVLESTGSPPFVQPMMERRRYIQKEISWGREGLALLENYWCAEDASSILRPNPIQREVWVRSNLPLLRPDTEEDCDNSKTLSSLDRTITSNMTAPPPTNDELSTNCDAALDVLPNPMFINNSASDVIDSKILKDFDKDNITNDDDRDNETADESLDDIITTFENSNITNFLVRGIVDRLDMVQDAENKSQISLRLIDYKSGKAPDLKYSPAMNRKIQNEAFDQLLIYALLLRESNRNKVNPMPLRYLRLFYLTSVHDQKAIYWDMDLGATQEERDAILHTVHVSLSKIYKNICKMIDQQDFTAFHGCQRSFCYCHKCRPRFVPGTVWEPPPSSMSS